MLGVPRYGGIPDGFKWAVASLGSLLGTGYAFYMGEPLPVTLEETKRKMLTRQTAVTHGG